MYPYLHTCVDVCTCLLIIVINACLIVEVWKTLRDEAKVLFLFEKWRVTLRMDS